MDRDVLTKPFRLKSPPDWPCPTCSKGILRIKKSSFVTQELRGSREAHSDPDWEPDWTGYTYSCMLECTNDKCRENVATIGTGFMDREGWYDDDGNFQEGYYDYFRPTFFQPHLSLIPVPATCPESVSKSLQESFKLFFSSPSAALNCIRTAIEELLTEFKVKRFHAVRGKRQLLSLHRRIELLPVKYASFKNLILAVKWLGNAGSHGDGTVTADVVMDAYELTSHILEEVYSSKGKRLQALATKVNKSKGPAK